MEIDDLPDVWNCDTDAVSYPRTLTCNARRYTKHVGLRDILKLPELEAQIAEGDLQMEDLESIWLEACAVKV